MVRRSRSERQDGSGNQRASGKGHYADYSFATFSAFDVPYLGTRLLNLGGCQIYQSDEPLGFPSTPDAVTRCLQQGHAKRALKFPSRMMNGRARQAASTCGTAEPKVLRYGNNRRQSGRRRHS
jgi:hypothetical protein